jgi:hypothetical protein
MLTQNVHSKVKQKFVKNINDATKYFGLKFAKLERRIKIVKQRKLHSL